MLDPKNINWKIVGAILLAVGYVVARNKGIKHLPKALAKHGAIAAVLAIVGYFGIDFVLKQVKLSGLKHADLPPEYLPHMIDQGNGRVGAYHSQQQQHVAAQDPNGNMYSPSLGC